VPREVIVSSVRGEKTATVKFTVDRYRTEYVGERAKFQEVLSALTSGERLSFWISTKRETVLPRQGWVPLYKVSASGQPILTYDGVVAKRKEGLGSVLVVGGALTGLGAWVVWLLVRTRQQYEALENARLFGEAPDESINQHENLAKNAKRIAAFLSVVFYAIVILTNLDSKVRAKQVEAFGAQPFGLPVILVVSLVETLLFVPIPWAVWHGMQMALQAGRDGRRFGFGYLFTAGGHHPHLRRSQQVCLGTLLYVIAIFAVWIIFAATRGI
jgi:hypothetical protein